MWFEPPLDPPCDEWERRTYDLTDEELQELIDEVEYRQYSAAVAEYEDAM